MIEKLRFYANIKFYFTAMYIKAAFEVNDFSFLSPLRSRMYVLYASNGYVT